MLRLAIVLNCTYGLCLHEHDCVMLATVHALLSAGCIWLVKAVNIHLGVHLGGCKYINTGKTSLFLLWFF